MSLSTQMIVHALDLLAKKHKGPKAEEMRDVCKRRAVSAAYYALFHHLNASAVKLIAPNVSIETNHRIQRWFDHVEMKKICGRFRQKKLDQPLLNL